MIAIASDHGAYALKEAVKQHLEARGLAYKDFGTDGEASCDYPDFVAPAAKAVASGECDRGIVLCTTGIGASITANKTRASAAPCSRQDVRPAHPPAQRHQYDGPGRRCGGSHAGHGDCGHLAGHRL